jgi:2-dehydropantoate 2-reductase
MERRVSARATDAPRARSARSTVAVVGLGSIGGVAAACLQDAGQHDIIACARRRLDHLILERPEGTVDVPLRP